MSNITINIPDDRWFRSEWLHRPEENQLCIVVDPRRDSIPWIGQYRKYSISESGHFLDVHDLIVRRRKTKISFALTSYWKPLNLLPDDEKSLIQKINDML